MTRPHPAAAPILTDMPCPVPRHPGLAHHARPRWRLDRRAHPDLSPPGHQQPGPGKPGYGARRTPRYCTRHKQAATCHSATPIGGYTPRRHPPAGPTAGSAALLKTAPPPPPQHPRAAATVVPPPCIHPAISGWVLLWIEAPGR